MRPAAALVDIGLPGASGFDVIREIAAMSPATRAPVAGSRGIWPDTKSRLPARTACEYGPMAFGAASVVPACRVPAMARP